MNKQTGNGKEQKNNCKTYQDDDNEVVHLCGHKFGSCLKHVQSLNTFDCEVRFDKLYVHIDFKGAPPKPEYLLQCFPLWKAWGATGIVFEWEDMLPFEGRLKVVRKQGCYTREEVQLLLDAAEKLELHCIPLVQTFGHLEFVLKHSEFSSFREIPTESLCLCPLAEGAEELARELIDQTLHFHPNADIIHIGCDEVFSLGACDKCRLKAMNSGLHSVYADFVCGLVQYCTNSKHIRPLIWHDMVASYPASLLSEKFGSHGGEPVLWQYGDVCQLEDSLWDNLYESFPKVWGATAFKGAAEPDAVWTPLHQRLANHYSWLDKSQLLMREKSRQLEAVVVTGWSRFSHCTSLCEILPVGLPSLCICLRMLRKGHFSRALVEEAARELGISLELLLYDNDQASLAIDTKQQPNFPGAKIFSCISKLESCRQLFLSSEPQNTSLEIHAKDVLEDMKDDFRTELLTVFYPEDVEEIYNSKFKKVLELADLTK